MSSTADPREPACPPGMRPHRVRVKMIHDALQEGMTGAICIDNTPEHVAWYLAELAKYPRLEVLLKGELSPAIYSIKVRKRPPQN